jgi:hypothetical protein
MADAVDTLIRTELARIAGAVEDRRPDWDALRPHIRRGLPGGRRRALRVGIAVAAAVAIAVPAVALSSGLRSLLGLRPHPDYAKARLVGAAPLPDGQVARLWASPSSTGGECRFVTDGQPGSRTRPTAMTGGGQCSVAPEKRHPSITWSFSSGPGATPSVLNGRVDPLLHPARVVLRWHGGAQPIRAHDGYFIAAAPTLKDPPFKLLPFDIVVLNAAGRQVAVSRIPTSFLYLNWKRVEPKLSRYRHAHGCSTTVLWRCRSR